MIINNQYNQPGSYPPQRPPASTHQIKRIYSQKTRNNEFMLTLIDPDLDGINPHDPHLNSFYKQKILRECLVNYWYFIREVVRVPSPGGAPMMYKLTRGNLALSFCQALDLNIFYEAPRLTN